MRKLKIMEHISLDGVIQQSADDDDFPFSEWTVPYRTPARSFELVSTQTTPTGILINSYKIVGLLKASSTHN